VRTAVTLVRVAPVLAVVAALLRLRGLAATARLLGVPISFDPEPDPADAGPEPSLSQGERRRAALLAVLVRRLYGDGGCLRQSLALGWMLRAHGPVVRIGVRPSPGDPSLHAWVEVAGRAVGRGRGFAPFVSTR
jgi:Transglutaminase-like superfamily